jgi:O-antigen ligase
MLIDRIEAGPLAGSTATGTLPRLLAASGAVALGLFAATSAHVLGFNALLIALALPLAIGALLDARFALALVFLSMTVLGSELRVYSVRILDLLIALGLLGLLFRVPVSQARVSGLRIGSAQIACLLLLFTVLISVIGAISRGTAGTYLSPDLHAVLMPVAIYFLIRAVLRLRGGAEWLMGLLVVGVVAASAKVIFLSAFGSTIADGPSSIWQAYVFTESFGTKRVVLVGADTLIALGPAILIAARRIHLLRNRRWIWAMALVGFAVAAGGTRSNILVAVLGVALVLGLELISSPASRATMARAATGVLVGAAVLLVAASLIPAGGQPIADGVKIRFTNEALEESSKQFRENEQSRVLEALDGKKTFGLGAGGTYLTQTSPYTWSQTLWAHNGFLWVALKSGFLGLASFVLGLLLLLLGLWRRRTEALGEIALIAVVGTLALSVTTNRLTDIGGSFALALAFAVLTAPRERERG